jgi:hypothetical protein
MAKLTDAELAAIDSDRDMEIDTLRDVLQDALTDAQARLREAEHAVKQLASDRLYDIEYAESLASTDLQQMLADASRAVRIALALKPKLDS